MLQVKGKSMSNSSISFKNAIEPFSSNQILRLDQLFLRFTSLLLFLTTVVRAPLKMKYVEDLCIRLNRGGKLYVKN